VSGRIAFKDDLEQSANGFFKEDDASGRMLVRRLIGFEEVECPH
jgi:hypothetical protein